MYYESSVQFENLSVTSYELFSLPKNKSGEILLYENKMLIGTSTIYQLRKEHEQYWYVSEIISPISTRVRILKDIIDKLLSICFIPIVILIALTYPIGSNKLMTQFTRIKKLYEQLGFIQQPDFSFHYLVSRKRRQ